MVPRSVFRANETVSVAFHCLNLKPNLRWLSTTSVAAFSVPLWEKMRTMNGHEKHLSLDLNLLITRTDFYLVCQKCQQCRAIPLCKRVPKGLVSLAMVHRCCIRWQFRQRHLQFPSPKWFHLDARVSIMCEYGKSFVTSGAWSRHKNMSLPRLLLKDYQTTAVLCSVCRP